jgi:hypothetical protein
MSDNRYAQYHAHYTDVLNTTLRGRGLQGISTVEVSFWSTSLHKHTHELTSVMLYEVDSHIGGYKLRWTVFLTVTLP